MNTNQIRLDESFAHDQGAFDRAIEIARELHKAGRWDGETPLRIHDAYGIHSRVFGLDKTPLRQVLVRKEGEELHALMFYPKPYQQPIVEMLSEQYASYCTGLSDYIHWLYEAAGIPKDIETDDLEKRRDAATEVVNANHKTREIESAFVAMGCEVENPTPLNVLAQERLLAAQHLLDRAIMQNIENDTKRQEIVRQFVADNFASFLNGGWISFENGQIMVLWTDPEHHKKACINDYQANSGQWKREENGKAYSAYSARVTIINGMSLNPPAPEELPVSIFDSPDYGDTVTYYDGSKRLTISSGFIQISDKGSKEVSLVFEMNREKLVALKGRIDLILNQD